jgi:GDP-L-fucose synthase
MKILITGGNGNIARIIKNHLSILNEYDITAPSKNELNILNFEEIECFLNKHNFDVLIHTAISGGRRTKEDNGDVTHNNLLMLENILLFSDKFKMIINLDSGAIYDRSTDIFNRKETDLFTIPTDYYGFSKYIIYKRSLQFKNFYNLRIFNIFHVKEEPDRFIKACFLAKQNNKPVTIFEDKYFDFVYEDDFIKIVKYYIDNYNLQNKLEKTINVCYEKKYKLSDIAKIIFQNDIDDNVQIINNELNKNYCGDGSKFKEFNLKLLGLTESLKIYEERMN